MFKRILVILLVLSVAACGRKGKLYLPDKDGTKAATSKEAKHG